jgi:hypothetical protein
VLPVNVADSAELPVDSKDIAVEPGVDETKVEDVMVAFTLGKLVVERFNASPGTVTLILSSTNLALVSVE